MNFVKRAMCYVRRKSGKSVLLFFLFLVADITILGTLSILDTSSMKLETICRESSVSSVAGVRQRARKAERNFRQQQERDFLLRYFYS